MRFRSVSQFFASFRNLWFRKLSQAFASFGKPSQAFKLASFRQWTFARNSKFENHGFSQGFAMGTLLMVMVPVAYRPLRPGPALHFRVLGRWSGDSEVAACRRRRQSKATGLPASHRRRRRRRRGGAGSCCLILFLLTGVRARIGENG